jgi:hypothetical protein
MIKHLSIEFGKLSFIIWQFMGKAGLRNPIPLRQVYLLRRAVFLTNTVQKPGESPQAFEVGGIPLIFLNGFSFDFIENRDREMLIIKLNLTNVGLQTAEHLNDVLGVRSHEIHPM